MRRPPPQRPRNLRDHTTRPLLLVLERSVASDRVSEAFRRHFTVDASDIRPTHRASEDFGSFGAIGLPLGLLFVGGTDSRCAARPPRPAASTNLPTNHNPASRPHPSPLQTGVETCRLPHTPGYRRSITLRHGGCLLPWCSTSLHLSFSRSVERVRVQTPLDLFVCWSWPSSREISGVSPATCDRRSAPLRSATGDTWRSASFSARSRSIDSRRSTECASPVLVFDGAGWPSRRVRYAQCLALGSTRSWRRSSEAHGHRRRNGARRFLAEVPTVLRSDPTPSPPWAGAAA